MAESDIVYTYAGGVYLNLTNRCTCNCIFCIRHNGSSLGSAENLWLKKDPTEEEIIKALEDFDFTPYKEVIICGYGEPLCALDNVITACEYLKTHYDIKIRINTNGLGDVYNKKSTVPILKKYIDTASISLNAPNAKRYTEVAKPIYGDDAFDAILKFAKECKENLPCVKFSVVDIISKEEIDECQALADSMGIPLRVRTWEH